VGRWNVRTYRTSYHCTELEVPSRYFSSYSFDINRFSLQVESITHMNNFRNIFKFSSLTSSGTISKNIPLILCSLLFCSKGKYGFYLQNIFNWHGKVFVGETSPFLGRYDSQLDIFMGGRSLCSYRVMATIGYVHQQPIGRYIYKVFNVYPICDDMVRSTPKWREHQHSPGILVTTFRTAQQYYRSGL